MTHTQAHQGASLRWLAVAAAVLALAMFAPAAHAQSAWDHYQKALEFQNQNDLENAHRELQKAVDKDDKNAFYHAALGLVLFNMSDCARAKPALSRALELDNRILDAHTALGTCYTVESNYAGAVEQFKASLALNPPDKSDVATLYNNLGEISSIQGDTALAEEYLNKAVSADPQLVTAHINLGNLYTTRQEYDKAVAAYKRAIELAPEYALAHNNLAFAFISMEDFPNAIAALDNALKIDPNNAYYRENRDYVQWAMQEPDRYHEGKLKGLPKEITLRPQGKKTVPRAKTNGVHVAQVAENPAAAQTPTEKPAVKPAEKPTEKPAEKPVEKPVEKPTQQPDTGASQPPPSELTTADNNPPVKTPVEKPVEKPVQTPPVQVQAPRVEPAMAGPSNDALAAMYYKGALYNLHAGKTREALRDLDRAQEMYPGRADYLAARGFIEIRNGKLMDAMPFFDRALQSDPSHAVSLATLGYLNDILGEHTVAEEKYAAAAKADPALGCASAGLATARVRRAQCDEQTDALFQHALDNGCYKGEMLNNQAFCALDKNNDAMAHTLGQKALQRSPANPVVAENFNFLVDVTGLPYDVVRDSEQAYDPYYRVITDTDTLPLDMFVPVAAVDFYNVFVSNWKTKTVLVVPFENPRGTAHMKPSPSDIYTARMASTIQGTGFFATVMPRDGKVYTYDELTRGGMLKVIADRNPADLIFVAELQRTDLENVTREKFMGLKKTNMVTASAAMPTLVLDAKTLVPVFQGPVMGTVDVPDKMEAEIGFRRLEQIRDDVFDDYARKVSHMLMYHFHLVRHPADKTLVRHMPHKEFHASEYH